MELWKCQVRHGHGTLCPALLAAQAEIELDEHEQGPCPQDDRRRQDVACWKGDASA